VPERLRAFRTALERYPELSGRVVLIQIVVPSRVEIPRYHEFKQRIDRLVGDINGRFSTSTWLPVQYHFRCLDREDLLAHYRGCDTWFGRKMCFGRSIHFSEPDCKSELGRREFQSDD